MEVEKINVRLGELVKIDGRIYRAVTPEKNWCMGCAFQYDYRKCAKFNCVDCGGKRVCIFQEEEMEVALIRSAVQKARSKHPKWNADKALTILIEEIGEVAREIQDGNKEREKAEILDAIAVLVRMYENE